MSSFTLKGRTALVTGASSGLGLEFARQLADAGSDLVLVARRKDRLAAIAKELTSSRGIKVRVVPLDLLSHDAPDELHRRLSDDGIVIDILINNAGFGVFGRFLDTDWNVERHMLALNMIVLTHLTKVFAADMVARGEGRILQIASIGAFQPSPTYASYSATKSYVINFGQAIDYELRKIGARCTVLSPGLTRTEFHEVAGQEKLTLYQRLTMMSPEKACRVGLRAMVRGKPSVLPGLMNKLSILLVKLIPRTWATAAAYRMMTFGAR